VVLPTASFGAYGNLPRNAFKGPNFQQFDFILATRFPLKENRNVEFRSEFFNIFNRANFGNRASTVNIALPSMTLVQLDYALIYSARRLITGANVHCAKQLIFVYEQAVALHNDGWPLHQIYQEEHEEALRSFVVEESRRRQYRN
jgi:hypothetical protein